MEKQIYSSKSNRLSNMLRSPLARLEAAQLAKQRLIELSISLNEIPEDCWFSIRLGEIEVGVNAFYSTNGTAAVDLFPIFGDVIQADCPYAENVPLERKQIDQIGGA